MKFFFSIELKKKEKEISSWMKEKFLRKTVEIGNLILFLGTLYISMKTKFLKKIMRNYLGTLHPHLGTMTQNFEKY